MAGWANARLLVEEEFRQSIEEGKTSEGVDDIRRRFDEASTDQERESLHAELLALPVREDFPFVEPDDLDGIRALRAEPSRTRTSDRADLGDLDDAMHGAWLGRSIGCALGKPVEAYMSSFNGLASWERQREYLTAIAPDEWPLRDYVPATSPAESRTGTLWCPPSTREHIAFMETDDDIRYTVLGQMILARYGTGFSSADVARTWLDRLPYNWVCTAETQAYRNLVAHYDAVRDQDPAFETEDPADIDWARVAGTLNPYREWIGAQIRVDSYGYAAPGNPELAAELAYRDARISHVKNGIYGAMFCAAMIAEAFVTDDVRRIIEVGLSQIPASSRLHAAIRQTVEICDAHDGDFAQFEAVIVDLYDAFGSYHATHTINNAAVVVASLLMSAGDFNDAVTFSVMAGWDTDCNGATVGSIVGAMRGASGIPAKWSDPLNDTLNSSIAGYHPIAISECARRSVALLDTPEGMSSWNRWW